MASEKLSPGEDFAVSAQTWSDIIDVVHDWRKRRSLGRAVEHKQAPVDPCRAWIRNDTTAYRRPGDVVGVGASLVTTLDAQALRFAGEAPAGHSGYAVLLSPAAADDIVRAQVTGICLSYVYVTSLLHTRAYPVAGQYRWQSGWCGPAEIVRAPASTGEQLCVVRLGNYASQQLLAVTPAAGSGDFGGIPAATYTATTVTPGSAACVVWRLASGVLEATAITETIYSYSPVLTGPGRLIHAVSDDNYRFNLAIDFCTNGFD